MTAGRRGGKVPPGWTEDELSDFIEFAQHNVLATFQNLSAEYALLKDVDRAFHRLLEHLDNPSDQLAPLFLYRAHAVWRAAVRLALSGQAAESYRLLRIAIEHALTASFLNRNPSKFDIWKRRSDSPADKKKVRNEFATGKLLDDLQHSDPGTYGGVNALYEECIDMGSHPTDVGIFANIATSETPEAVHLDTQYLVGDSPQLRYALKICARVGVAVLKVDRLIFKERYDLLGLTQTLDDLTAQASRGAA